MAICHVDHRIRPEIVGPELTESVFKRTNTMSVSTDSTRPETEPVPDAPPAGIDAAALKASIASDLFGDLAAPMKIDRYEVEAPLGEGGMGVVYAARDPVLGRRVALKLLSSAAPTDERRRARMVREAQALARLSHPNVVQVYEVGVHGDDMFVAMELVEGVSLRDWLESSPKLAQIEEVFVQAGRGLAAAHEADLVHRDFKPTNVMVGHDGRVRVLDFGLAFGPGLSTETSGQISSQVSVGSGIERLTRTGAVMGTPAYMAPEQIRGELADDRADQFSFCVALFEAVTGSRPYKFNDLRKRPESAIVAIWDGVPHAWRAPLRRGLAIAASDRWPTMHGLLAALRRRRKWAARAPWLFVGGAVTLAVAARSSKDPPPEPDPCAWLSDALPGWGERRAKAIGGAFAATGQSYANDVWASSRRRIDKFSDSWADTRRTVCASNPQPEALACLERAQSTFAAVVDEYEGVSRRTVGQVHQLGTLLESPSACALRGGAAFDHGLEPAVLERVAEARAANTTGRYNAVIDILDEVEVRPGLAGTDAHAEVLRLRGAARYELADIDGALSDLSRSFSVANSSVARANASVSWIQVLLEEERDDSARAIARILANEVGSEGPQSLRADLMQIRGLLRVRSGEVHDGIRTLRASLELREELGDEVAAAATRTRIANALDGSDDPSDRARAETLYRDEVERRRREIGPNHPSYAGALFNLARSIQLREDWVEVERLLRECQRIEESTLPEDSQALARTRLQLADALFHLDRLDEADEMLDTAWLTIQRLPETNIDHQAARGLLANFTRQREQWRATIEHHLALSKYQPDNPLVWQNLAIAYVNTEQPAKARNAALRARALLPLQQHFPELMVTLLGIDFELVEVDCLRLEGKHAEAKAEAKRIRGVLESIGEIDGPFEKQRQHMLEHAAEHLE